MTLQEQKTNYAKKLFDMHVNQNKYKKNYKLLDALEYAATESNVNIFELSKELDLEFYYKNEN